MRHALEATRRTSTLLKGRRHEVEVVAELESTRDCRKCVVDVRRANERRVKIAFARRRDETKSHPTQRELRIASSHVRIVLHRIPNDVQAIFLKRRRQLNTVRIVDVDDGMVWPRSEATVKQSLFRVPVVLHRFVIIEVIAREVRENGNGVFELVTTMKVHRLRGTLHHSSATANLHRAPQ